MEIKATDLRIGNWINFKGLWNGQVSEVSKSGFIGIFGNGGFFDVDSLSGIPLTEELLFKMGFIYHDYVWYHKDTAIVTILGVDGCLVVHVHSQPLTHIRFLHQLQNNFYFNTDIELTLS